MNWALLLAASILVGTPQQPPVPPAGAPAEAQKPANGSGLDPEALPVSLDKIQKAITQAPAIRIEGDTPVFRTEVFGRKPTIEDILGPDFHKGPVAYGGMTHQEFLNMVTPKDVQGYAAFTNGEGFTVAATSLALQWALLKAIDKFRDARSERQKEAARKEVQEALKELERARERAGLPSR